LKNIVITPKKTNKEVTEEVIIKQGGRSWLLNLRMDVLFIVSSINVIMNTFSISKIGKKLITHLLLILKWINKEKLIF
jgi:hypothetical protein